jgi:hypothetical protein
MSQRVIGIGFGVLAIVLLVFAPLSRSWLVSPNRSDAAGFGLRIAWTCELDSDDCRETSNSGYVERLQEASEGVGFSTRASSLFAPIGWITFITCLAAAATLAMAVGLAVARKQPQLPIAPTSVTILSVVIALIAGCLFLAMRPDTSVGPGWAFWAFGAGCVLGFLGAHTLNKVNRPPDPDLTEDAMNPDHF